MAESRNNVSVFSAFGMTILGTTCCALPLTLVALGAGAAVASLASAAPWLIVLSQYKAWTFGVTGAILAYAWWQSRRVEECDIADAKRLRFQKRMMTASTVIFGLSLFAAYALLPLMVWLQGE